MPRRGRPNSTAGWPARCFMPTLPDGPTRRAAPQPARPNGLWSYGISGDAPLVLLHLSDPEKIEIIRQLIRAHAYWRLKGLTVELVILNEDVSVYRQSPARPDHRADRFGIEAQMLDKPGGIFVRHLEQIPPDDRVLLQCRGADCPRRRKWNPGGATGTTSALEPFVPALAPTRAARPDSPQPVPPRELIFPNGIGGFTRRWARVCRHAPARPD